MNWIKNKFKDRFTNMKKADKIAVVIIVVALIFLFTFFYIKINDRIGNSQKNINTIVSFEII